MEEAIYRIPGVRGLGCCAGGGEELARYKVPVAVHLLDELPKGPTGKILRRALRATNDAAA